MAPKHRAQPLNLAENARVILERRYLARDDDGKLLETPEALFRRVAENIASAEGRYDVAGGIGDDGASAWAGRFYDLMTSLRFLPNSPTLGNAGRPLQQLSACFVLPVEDSMSSIFDAVKETALIHQSGGGTGFAFSRLRPSGDVVRSTGGVASGPVSFMRVFDAATEAIKQGGTRRGANMAILDVHHPDIEAFINLKADMTTLTNFNISVAVDEAFLGAVEVDGEFDLISPRTGEVVARRRARAVFDQIVANAWRNGDPGLVFLDRINADNPTPQLGAMEATNPCVTGDTWVQTSGGPRQVRDIVGVPECVTVNGKAQAVGPAGFFFTGVKSILRVRTAEGYELRLTPDHLVQKVARLTRYVAELEWAPAAGLRPGDRVQLNDHRAAGCWPGPYGEAEGYLCGLLVGDGNLQEDKAVLSVWPQSPGYEGVMQAALAANEGLKRRSDFGGWRETPHGNHVLVLGAVKQIAGALGITPGNKAITSELEQTSSDFYKGFLRGLFDADGSVQGTHAKGVSVRLAQSNLVRLQAVQRMLLRLGIVSRIYEDRRVAGRAFLPDGRGGRRFYATLSQHELVISGENLVRYRALIGFADTVKASKLDERLAGYRRRLSRERFFARVSDVSLEAPEAVFDVQVPVVNAFDANGFVVHNCGEQPLLPYESCNLGSLNLARFVMEGEASAPRERVDWEGLAETIPVAVRFLDNVIDMNAYPVEAIGRQTRVTRKIGLGVMGWADMLFALDVPYDSKAALALADEVMGFIRSHADAASEALAQERGVFPAWEASIYGPEGQGEHGRGVRRLRNSTRTTVAPTGTLSIIADCSGGIEPAFSLAFTRQHYLDPKNPTTPVRLTEVNKAFEAVARAQGFYSEALIEHLAGGGSLHERPEVPVPVRRRFVTAHEVAPSWHVRMQAAFQRHTDNAVSKTINFPRQATIGDVAEAYRLAYREGCKGITIYRDGSRTGQVLSHVADGEGVPADPEAVEGAVRGAGSGKSDEGLSLLAPSPTTRSRRKGTGGGRRRGAGYVPPRPALPFSEVATATACPDCGTALVFAEGCLTCRSCGYTKCG